MKLYLQNKINIMLIQNKISIIQDIMARLVIDNLIKKNLISAENPLPLTKGI